MAAAHHCANRRWNDKEPAHTLRTGFPREHEDTRDDLHQYAYEGHARQRYVLLFHRGFADKRFPHHSPALRRRLHHCQRPHSVRTTQTNHHSHQGGQPSINYAYQGDVDRIEKQIVASQR